MKQTIKKPLLFVAALLPLMIVGSIFTGIYSFSTYNTDIQNEMIAQIGSYELLLLVGTVQSILCASVAGFMGYILSEKTGLMRSFRFEKKQVCESVLDYGYIWNTVQLGLLDIWQGFTRSSGNI